MVRYQDWTGERKQKCKRGFATKREAAQWEQQFILQKKQVWIWSWRISVNYMKKM